MVFWGRKKDRKHFRVNWKSGGFRLRVVRVERHDELEGELNLPMHPNSPHSART